jgi:hypothetical protein
MYASRRFQGLGRFAFGWGGWLRVRSGPATLVRSIRLDFLGP